MCYRGLASALKINNSLVEVGNGAIKRAKSSAGKRRD
jgi:hypothetical protein